MLGCESNQIALLIGRRRHQNGRRDTACFAVLHGVSMMLIFFLVACPITERGDRSIRKNIARKFGRDRVDVGDFKRGSMRESNAQKSKRTEKAHRRPESLTSSPHVTTPNRSTDKRIKK